MMDAWQEKERRNDARAALLSYVIARCHGAKSQLEDFMPYQGPVEQVSLQSFFEAKVEG